MAEKDIREAKETTTVQERFRNPLELLQHTLNCLNPECLLPHCVNMKLAMKHTQSCKKIICQVCQQMKSLASKHAESCDDLYCCTPFCMEEKLKAFMQSHTGDFDFLDNADSYDWRRRVVEEDESSGGDNLYSYPANSSRETPQNTESRPSAKESEFKSKETAINRKATAREFSSPLRPRTSTYPPQQLKSMHFSGPLNKPHSFAKSFRLRPEQSRYQSSAIEKVAMTTTQVDASREPGGMADLVKTGTHTTPRPLLVEKGCMQKDEATKQRSWKELSLLSPVPQDKNCVSYQTTHPTVKGIREVKEQSNASFFASAAEVPRSSSGAISICNSRDGAAIMNNDGNTQALLKARLIDSMYNLLRLGMQKMETREELIVCINSLKKAVDDMKTLE